MAGFCRNCGTPLGDGEAFCKKCGTPVAGAPTRAAAAVPTPPTPVVPVPAAYAPAPAAPVAAVPVAVVPTKSSSPLLKILLVVVIIFFLFGAIGIASLMYVGYRVKQKANEMGLHVPSDMERTQQAAEMKSLNACSLLSKAEVSAAIGMEVVRAESDTGDTPSCTYSVMGDQADLTAKHVAQMHKGELDKKQQEMVENFGKTVFQSAESEPGRTPNPHPGEAPVLAFSIDPSNAEFQLKLSRATFGRLGPGVATLPNLGDDNFDAYGAMLLVRKGDKLIRVMYMTCPCGSAEVVPLIRKVVAKL
jgi:hypothetical protein